MRNLGASFDLAWARADFKPIANNAYDIGKLGSAFRYAYIANSILFTGSTCQILNGTDDTGVLKIGGGTVASYLNGAHIVLESIGAPGLGRLQLGSADGAEVQLSPGGSTTMRLTAGLNIALFANGSYGSGAKVLFMGNADTTPSGTPSGGGILYVDAGALKYKGSSGTVTTVGAA